MLAGEEDKEEEEGEEGEGEREGEREEVVGGEENAVELVNLLKVAALC